MTDKLTKTGAAVGEPVATGSAPSGAFLDVRDLKIHFPTDDGLVKSVDGLSFQLEKGKTLGIVGESGSGKSVTSLGIMGLHTVGQYGRREGEDLGRDLARRPGAALGRPGRGPQDARPRHGDDLPGPAVRDAPVLHGRQPDRGGVPRPPRRRQEDGAQAGRRTPRPGRHPRARQAVRQLPARVLRRHAPARDDRHGARQQPRAAHRRRADHRARRDRAGPDPRSDAGPPEGVRLRGRHHHPRPRRRRRARRRHPRDVRRALRRARTGRVRLLRAAAPLHLGPARLDAEDRPRPDRAAHPGEGQPAQPHQHPERLRLQPPLPVRGRPQGRHHAHPAAGTGAYWDRHFSACHMPQEERTRIWTEEIAPKL